MTLFPPEQIDYLAQGLAKILNGPGTGGEIAYLRCLDEAAIVLLCSSSAFQLKGWEIRGVTAQTDESQRLITADRAVEIREDKGPAHVLLIDYLHAGAGLDGIYNACREVTEEQFYEEAIRLLRRKMRGWAKFADEAMTKAQRLNARSRLTPRQRFEFHAALALGQDRGASLATLGLWPVKLGDKPTAEDLTNSARLVEKLLLVNVNKLTPAERVQSLLLDPETPPEVRIQLEEFTGNAAVHNARDAVRELVALPNLWLNAIRPAFSTDKLRTMTIEPWLSPNGTIYKWSGLITAGEGFPEFRINPDAKLDVRWRVAPEELPAGAVEYQIAIRSGEHEIASQVQSHTGKPQQVCRFSQEDFTDLDEQGRYEAEVIISVLGDPHVDAPRTEPFQIVFGDTVAPTTSSISGITVRSLVDGAIQCDTLEEFEEACVPTRLDASGKDTISFRPLKSGRGFRIHRPPLLRQAEESWFKDSSTICRWKARILDDGSVVGDLERIPLLIDAAEEEGKKLLAAVGKFAKFTESVTGGLGLVARIYGPSEKATEEYLREWANTLISGDPKLALAYTIEVESLSGVIIGLIVLPMHPLRVAWHVGYDLLAKHARYSMNEDLKTIKRVLARLDGASFPMMLPGIKDGESFIYGDTLGAVTGGKSGNSFHAVAMVRANDREPRAAVALVAQCYLGENQKSVSPAGNRAADLLAKEIERYRAYHSQERPKFLHIHGLRPGDGSILAGALGKFLGTEQDSEDASGDRSFGYVLRLHPSTDSSTVTGRFFTHLNEQRRSGSKTIPAEYRWIHDSFSLNDQHRLPRLRWYKAKKEPEEYAHLSIAFDTFETNVVALSDGELAEFDGKQPRHGYGLICCPARYWSFHPPRSQVLPPRGFEGKVHPHHKNVTERLEKLQHAVATAVARQLNPTGVWPVMQAQLSDEHERELEVVHRLSDWVITLDRHAAVEYFDSPKEAGKVYDSYVIDCQPERDDLGSLQMITSTANLQEVRQLLDRSLAEMGLSSSRQNCEFLLRQLKALSGRLAIRLVSDATQQEIIALAMVYAQSCHAKVDDPVWPPLTDGFFLPLDDLRDLIPHSGEVDENEPEEDESRAESRADLVYVTTLKKGPGLEFRFIEVKYRRTLMSARASILITRINNQIDQAANRWQAEFNGDGLSPFFQRGRLYRVLRFYADKARRHDLGEPAYLKIQTQLERILTDEKVPFAMEVSKHRGFIFCPDYRGELPDELQKSPEEPGVYLFGPHPFPDLLNRPLQVDAPDEKEVVPETPKASYTEPVAATESPKTEVSAEVRITLGTTADSAPVDWTVSIRGNPHLMIVGLPGMGKTTAILNLCAALTRQGVVPLVFSYHQDIDEKLSPVLPGIRLLSPFDIGFDPLRIEKPAPFAQIERAGMLRDIFSAIFPGLGDIQLAEIYEAIKTSYSDRGWGSSVANVIESPPFGAFFEILKHRPKPDRGLLSRLTELDDFGLFAGGGKTTGLLENAEPCILQIHKTPSEIMQRAFASLMFQKLYQDMFRRGVQQRITHAIVFDEAHRASRLKLIPTMAKECRKYGIALILASQEAKDFDDSLYSAVGNFLVLKVAEPDARRLAKNLVSSDQEKRTSDRMKQLPKFQAMFRGGEAKTQWIQLADFQPG